MTRRKANQHPSIAPLLRRWHEAKANRDRVLNDRRYSDNTRRGAEAEADRAFVTYDRAVLKLMETS